MNVNPNAKTVLCYGDSNTHGSKPDRSGRYVADVRWTGLLQKQLGDEYYVIEEGLGGRTTDLEHPNPAKPSRNGLVYFKACLNSHAPLDFIIIMLGTNDLKKTYNRTPQDVADALHQYTDYVYEFYANRDQAKPKVIIVSPPYMDATASNFVESMPQPGVYDEVSAEKSHHFAEPFRKLADETGCLFFDAAPIAKTGEDGCHLTAEAHQNLANSLEEIVKTTLKPE